MQIIRVLNNIKVNKDPYSRQKSFTKTVMLLVDIGCNLLVASTETMANNLVGLLMSPAQNNLT